MKLSVFRNPKPIAALALIALASLITFALLADAPSASAQTSPQANGRIAFSSDRGLRHDIYVMNSDGTGVSRLTNTTWSGSARHPTWSPNGNRIAFYDTRVHNYDIYVMNSDGSNVTRLTNDYAIDFLPAWSPDGKRIAFSSDRRGGSGVGHWFIYVMNSDGSNVTKLTTNIAEVEVAPAWSPDSNRIAFSSHIDGNAEIYVINADGSSVTRLTNHSGRDSDPAWSPDGNQIAFSSDRSGDTEIYVMNADGTGVSRLTNTPGDYGSYTPDWTTHAGGQAPVSPTPTHTPIATPIHTPTHTPIATPATNDIAGRVGALEQQMGALQRLMLNIQSLIQALHNRLDSLEQGGGVAPVATPTPTATATPSPTPTRVSRPAPTPVSSDACVQPIGDPDFTSIDGTSFYGISGTWTTACVTANPPNRDSDTRYAKFYTFAVSAEAEVSITLTSDEPNYLHLLSGAGRRGTIVQRVGDTPSWTNTITATLQPGNYTIEATTYYPRAIDSFTLVMTIDAGDPGYQFYLPSPTPTPLAAACVQPIEHHGSTSGAWTPACVSVSRTGYTYYAKFYTFTLTQASTVTITLTSEDVPDTYLYLLEGAGGSGAILHHNDDIDTAGGDFGSRISESLPAGIYTIEATTNYRNVTGNFTLELRLSR